MLKKTNFHFKAYITKMKYEYKTYSIDYDYNNSNKNDTVLFLHGWRGDKKSFEVTKNLLKNKYNMLSISFPPNGSGTIPLELSDFVCITKNILDLHNIKNIFVICHSFGFRIALLLHNQYQIIKKLVVTSGAGIRLKQSFFQKLQRNMIKVFLKDKKRSSYFYNKFASTDYKSLSPIDQTTFKNIVNVDLNYCLNDLKMPLLLFWGQKDKETSVKVAKFIKRKLENAKLVIKKDAGHFAYIVYNFEFNKLCIDFLSKKECIT